MTIVLSRFCEKNDRNGPAKGRLDSSRRGRLARSGASATYMTSGSMEMDENSTAVPFETLVQYVCRASAASYKQTINNRTLLSNNCCSLWPGREKGQLLVLLLWCINMMRVRVFYHNKQLSVFHAQVDQRKRRTARAPRYYNRGDAIDTVLGRYYKPMHNNDNNKLRFNVLAVAKYFSKQFLQKFAVIPSPHFIKLFWVSHQRDKPELFFATPHSGRNYILSWPTILATIKSRTY